ncbi:MAG: N-acetylglucosamine-6-phosphate deacetylase [Lachnospiraceae bacterium]|nr:N-acetylglucosamine-6-phosphate deacetylase [Lachnospiraceae bacterium]
MIIKNADVYTEDGKFVNKDIYIDGAFFAEKADDDIVIDATGCYAIPALTDMHFHGCAGYDFSDGSKEAIDAIARYEASVGVTNIIPATMTLPENELIKICDTARLYQPDNTNVKKARLCGINLEGPFISPAKKGAQNPEYIMKPDIALFDKLNAASGNMIKLVSIAPELEGAMEFIEKKQDEVIISLGHTDADYDTALRAFGKGAKHVTHLYNAMKPYGHREPGLIGAAADLEGVYVEIICDGVHVHPAAVRTAFKIFGEDRIIFVSDSMRATGLGDGCYSLGGQDVKVEGNLATLKDGTIAGSVTNLMDCLRIAVLEMGIPLETAVKCAAVNPVRCVGIYDRCGGIAPRKVADLVLLEKETLEIVSIVLNGKN